MDFSGAPQNPKQVLLIEFEAQSKYCLGLGV